MGSFFILHKELNMNIKVTGLLAVLLLLLVGFVMFYERPRMDAEQKVSAAEKEFLNVARQTVAKFTIVNQHGRFVAEKRGNEWHIVEPVETAGDWDVFESMVTTARAVERGRVVVDAETYGKTDLATFGLAPPHVELRFEDQSGEDIWLLFGDDNPVGRAAYLTWSGSNNIVLTQRSNRNRFGVKLMDIRDQHVLPFDLDQVQQIVLKHSGQTFEMVRNGFTWQIVQPGNYVGDGAEINNILGTVRSELIVEVVAETFDDPSKYGFDTPQYEFVVTYKDGETRTLTLGKNIEDARSRSFYAYNSERPYVFLIETFVTDFLKIDLSDVRYKRVFEFDRNGIDRIQLAYIDSTVACVLEGDSWIVKQPLSYVGKEVFVDRWIDKVYTMEVADFVGRVENLSDYGLAKPVLTVSLWHDDKLVREVLIGRHLDGWYGKVNGSDEVFAFDTGVMSGLRLPVGEAPTPGIQLGVK
ncbi:MAG: hypothetical protein ACI8V2_004779 [Candidatus Latescibacterota bacterium]